MRIALAVAATATFAVSGALGSAIGWGSQQPSVSAAAWLSGCWIAASGASRTEEIWSGPSGGSMLGMSRTVRDGSTTGHEFLLLRAQDGRLLYSAYPSGQAPTDFTVTHLSSDTLRVESPEHDFPKKIEYVRLARDSVIAHVYAEIDSEAPAFSLRYARYRCAGEADR